LRSNFGHKTDANGSNKGEFDEIHHIFATKMSEIDLLVRCHCVKKQLSLDGFHVLAFKQL